MTTGGAGVGPCPHKNASDGKVELFSKISGTGIIIKRGCLLSGDEETDKGGLWHFAR